MSEAGAVRIAGGQGFYGDTPTAVDALLHDGVDYLCLEALAELTLAILQKDRQRDEARGYTRDLPLYLARALPFVADGKTKIVTNAGGINPAAAAHVAMETARQLGVSGVSIATVVGDDVLARLRVLHDEREQTFAHLDTGDPFSAFRGPALFASAYLGARPIVEALERGADVVITGRVADASLFLAACAHAHGWAWDDWDRLAAGILVGHLLECSGQSLGGNYSGDWWALPHPWDLPYPIATVDSDGTAVISKPAGAGGRVSTDTLRHQLLYEVHDPARYLSPDVVADFTSAQFEDLPDDRVRITAVRGRPATGTYKLLLASHAGWAGEARVAFSWPDAYEKAKATAAILMKRVEMAGLAVDEWCLEYWGFDALGRPDGTARRGVRTTGVCAARRVAMRRPTHGGTRRTRARAAHSVGATRRHDRRGSRRRERDRAPVDLADTRRQDAGRCRSARRDRGRTPVTRLALRELCGYRSGDKGDVANVALFADDDETFDVIRREATAERVKAHFAAMVTGRVDRYEAANVRALNFVMYGALGGGGPRSLRADALGKTLGGALVRMEIDVPDHMAARRRPRPDVTWADDVIAERSDSSRR